MRCMTFNFELEHDFKVLRGQGEARPEPACLRGAILGETNVAVGVYDGIGAKVPEFVLEVGVDIRGVNGVAAEGDDCV